MSDLPPRADIPVGVIVERRKGTTQWAEFYWRATGVLVGEPETPPWTRLNEDGDHVTFYAGTAVLELRRTETGFYRDNLASGSPSLWVSLRVADGDPPFTIGTVTADPAEGESFAEAGTDLVEQVPMPVPLQQVIAAFVEQHHVEQPFVKRKRDRADPEAMARRDRSSGDKFE
jgi:hypothetical protein